MDETFFVKIDKPNKLRVSVLAASKASLESLKLHLRLHELHKEKVIAKTSLDNQFTELVSTLHELATFLPHQEILDQAKKATSKSKKKSTSKEVVSKRPEPVKKHTELDKLNEALEEIEKRLSTLQ
jgi:hypothetical protein